MQKLRTHESNKREIVDETAKYFFGQFENYCPSLSVKNYHNYRRSIQFRQLNELMETIKTFRKCAACHYNIHPLLLQHTSPTYCQRILHLYNIIWLTGNLLIKWQEVIILLIHNTHLEDIFILDKYQSGFQQNRSTVDNIIRLQ